MIPEYFIFFALAFYAIGYYFYLKDMFVGETRPNIVSWFLWMLAPFIGVFFQLKAGAGLSVLPVFMGGFGPLVVLLVIFFRKNLSWRITAFDLLCGAFSLIALILYIFTRNLSLSIIFAILSDALAFIPTYKKSWINPKSETAILYIASMLVNVVGILIIKTWSFPIYSFGIYLIVGNLIEILIIYRKRFANLFVRMR